MFSKGPLVVLQFRAEGNDGGGEPPCFGPCDGGGRTVALSCPPALDRRDLSSGQRGARLDSQIEGPQQGGQRVARTGALGVHRAPPGQKDPQCFPETLGPGADEFGRGRSQDGPGGADSVDRIGFAVGATGLPPLAAWPHKLRSAPPRAGASALPLRSSSPRPRPGHSPSGCGAGSMRALLQARCTSS